MTYSYKIIFICLCLILNQNISSQSCFPNGLTISTQESLDAFVQNYSNCNEIEGYLKIVNSSIISLGGLDNILKVKGDLMLEHNDSLISISGLDNLDFIGGMLKINGNNRISSIDPLIKLDTVLGSIVIWENDKISSLHGLDSLQFLGGNLGINYSPQITSLPSLNYISHIYGNVTITDNMQLISLNGLNNLTIINGILELDGNPLIQDLSGLNSLSILGGGLAIYSCPSLESLEGLDNLMSISGSLILSNNYNLSSISSLSNLDSITQDLKISGSNLSNLDDLINVKYINWSLILTNNLTLNNISGLSNIFNNANLESLLIYNNPELNTCNVPIVCDHLIGLGMNTVANNATGCNSSDEIISQCQSTKNNNAISQTHLEFQLFPNPTKDILQIEKKGFPTNQYLGNIEITNFSGERIKLFNAYQGDIISLKSYPPGFYIFTLRNQNSSITKSILKF